MQLNPLSGLDVIIINGPLAGMIGRNMIGGSGFSPQYGKEHVNDDTLIPDDMRSVCDMTIYYRADM